MNDYSPNVPILYRNIMDGLPSPLARSVFLWAVERPNEDAMCYRAEAFAREADKIVTGIRPMLEAGFYAHKAALRYAPPSILCAVLADLEAFILTRHANWRYGGNVKPTYAQAKAGAL